jgi:hypothetical protein
MANAFSKKIAPTSADKAEVLAKTTDEIQTQVDKFVLNKSEIKKLTAQQAALEEAIISHVRPQQDEMAYCGSFTKSLTVPGKDFQVKYVTMDKFTVPQGEDKLYEIKTLVGKKYDEMFESKDVYSLKDDISKDDKKMNALAKACEKAGIDITQYFDRTNKIISRNDLDVKQYELTQKQLVTFRTLVTQVKPSLR